MTPEEQQMLGGLVERVQRTRLTEKDPEAEQMILQGLGRSPDALYVLAQTVLVQNMALEQAQGEVRRLQQQQPPPAKATSFLGSLLGHHDPPPPPPSALPQNYGYPPQQYGNPGYSSGPPMAVPMTPPISGAGGFLRSAATTAAGVAAGALAFEGIESLMHGGFGGGGFGGGFGRSMGIGGMGGGPAEETVINNYYDDPGAGGRELHHEHPASFDDRNDSPRIENADYETRADSQDLNTSGVDSDLDDSVFNDPGDASDSSDFSGGDDSNLV